MRIESGIIGMESARRYSASRTQYSRFVLKENKEERLQAKASLTGEETKQQGENAKAKNTGDATVEYVSDLRKKVESMRFGHARIRERTIDFSEKFRHYTTRYIFMLLFGEDKTREYLGEEEKPDLQEKNRAVMEFTPMRQMVVSKETYYGETESVHFKAEGKVTTADGREISFSLEVGMSRSFEQYYREEFDMQEFLQLYDPLVINFDEDFAVLKEQKFFFDIDADGEKEELWELGKGSGYLVLDRNEDGQINDGSELFGPESGDGFGDLARYDEDGNGWIDENDSVFQKIKVWCRDEFGGDYLYTLGEKGIGALCLQNANTEFSLTGEGNEKRGFLRSSGIFLYEDGKAGTLQHIDLVQ